VQVGVKENLGHPTLTEGQKGRIGGKLRRDPETGTWTVNGSSGRYTKNYKRTQAQLDAAAEEIKAAGIDVRKTVPLLN
jgi:hypothetical protein